MENFVEGEINDNIKQNNITINEFFEQNLNSKPYRYGDSLIFKVYNPVIKSDKVFFKYFNDDQEISDDQIDSDINDLVNQYAKILNIEIKNDDSSYSRGIFYMENQLEDFIISNWQNTELGKKYDLIYEEGELRSKQYRTEIGNIDILAIDKKTKSYVVIELKRNQTSDDTVGQLMRHMGGSKLT